MAKGVNGYNYPDRKGSASTSWRGGRQKCGNGAVYSLVHLGHPNADDRGRVYEHVLVAEKALGKFLPVRAEVHHVDCVRTNNAPSNLVVCPDHAYHAMLHRRMRAAAGCGDPNKVKCVYCKQWDVRENLIFRDQGPKGISARHSGCYHASKRFKPVALAS